MNRGMDRWIERGMRRWMETMRTIWMAGAALHKSGRYRDKSRSDNYTQISLDLR